MINLIRNTPLLMFIMISATLGLAPFVPEPHVWQKLQMLAAGELHKGIDWFDLLMHGTPWILLGIKVGITLWDASCTKESDEG